MNQASKLGVFASFYIVLIGGLANICLADDAFVLPTGVFRFSLGTTTVSGTEEFATGGARATIGRELGATVKAFGQGLNLATGNTFPGASWDSLNPMMDVKASTLREDLAFEYGLTDSTSLSIQLPIYLSATIRANQNTDLFAALATLNATGAPSAGSGKLGELFRKLATDGKAAGSVGDLLLGVKYQVAHSGTSRISRDEGSYRAAIAGGFSAPTGSIASPDSLNLSTTTASDTKSWILGARTYFDFQFTSWLYLNLHTEHEYRLAGTRQYLVTNTSTASYSVVDTKFRPGMFNRFEADLSVSPEIIPNLNSESGVVMTADWTGEGKYTEAPTEAASIAGTTTAATKSLRLAPYLGVFYTGAPMPIKFKTSYYAPLSGEGTKILNGLTFLLQAYFKF